MYPQIISNFLICEIETTWDVNQKTIFEINDCPSKNDYTSEETTTKTKINTAVNLECQVVWNAMKIMYMVSI